MKKIRLVICSLVALFVIGAVPVYAQSPTPTSTLTPTPTSTPKPSSTATPGKCGTTKTQLIACEGTTGIGTISSLIKIAINIMTILIGIVATGGLAYAGVLYASARDDQTKVANAMGIIRNIVIGLIMYGFTIAIINWLIPGGVIG